jgi:hypothetical protein
VAIRAYDRARRLESQLTNARTLEAIGDLPPVGDHQHEVDPFPNLESAAGTQVRVGRRQGDTRMRNRLEPPSAPEASTPIAGPGRCGGSGVGGRGLLPEAVQRLHQDFGKAGTDIQLGRTGRVETCRPPGDPA